MFPAAIWINFFPTTSPKFRDFNIIWVFLQTKQIWCMRVVNLGAVVVAQVVAQVDYGSRGPGFDSHWELGFFIVTFFLRIYLSVVCP